MKTLTSFYALQKKKMQLTFSEKKLVIDRTNCNIKSFMSLTI